MYMYTCIYVINLYIYIYMHNTIYQEREREGEREIERGRYAPLKRPTKLFRIRIGVFESSAVHIYNTSIYIHIYIYLEYTSMRIDL
jgi:hypothetical protein